MAFCAGLGPDECDRVNGRFAGRGLDDRFRPITTREQQGGTKSEQDELNMIEERAHAGTFAHMRKRRNSGVTDPGDDP
jgi:hypothetical protein